MPPSGSDNGTDAGEDLVNHLRLSPHRAVEPPSLRSASAPLGAGDTAVDEGRGLLLELPGPHQGLCRGKPRYP